MNDKVVGQPIPLVAIGATLGTAIRLIRAEWKKLFFIMAMPLGLLALLGIILPANSAIDVEGITQISADRITRNMTTLLVTAVVYPWVAASVLRYFVLSEPPRGWLDAPIPHAMRYLWKILLVMVVSSVAAAPIILLSFLVGGTVGLTFGILLGMLLASVVGIRIGLAVPAAALGGDAALKTSWARTRGQVMRIMTIKFLFSIMMLLPFLALVLILMVVGMASKPLALFLGAWLGGMIQYAAIHVIDAILYRHFYGDASSAAIMTAEIVDG